MFEPQKFWDSLDKGGECWLWRGAALKSGYGQVNFPRADGGKQPTCRAHRLAYKLFYGPLPADAWVLHTCDVRRCCRPSHLFAGSHRDNMRDMVAKGRNRTPRPRPHGQIVGTVLAERITALIAAGMGRGTVARIVGVSPTTVTRVLKQ